ncbi:MarR family winged helix-turn-helix transcriptional regulator [Niallia sp. 03133]|uniref:MarR family winged helix-turn-helix transcriptional regulator n=1 Tax=Niallia sp. 03133 TaxID=3458060 RepID=UPI004043F921
MIFISNLKIKDVVDRYVDINFSVNRKLENLIKLEIGDVLTCEQHYTLRYINRVKVCTSSELAMVFGVKKSAITSIVNRLFEKEYIKRTRDEKDRRVIYLTMTDKGNSTFTKMEERIYLLVESIINKFDETEIQNFLTTFEKLDKLIMESKEIVVEEKE